MKTKILFSFCLLMFLLTSCGKGGPGSNPFPPSPGVESVQVVEKKCNVAFGRADTYEEIATKAYLMSKECGWTENKIIAAAKKL